MRARQIGAVLGALGLVATIAVVDIAAAQTTASEPGVPSVLSAGAPVPVPPPCDEIVSPDLPSLDLVDVSCRDQFFHEVWWLVDREVAAGFEDGTFRSAIPVSRQAFAAFLFRLAGSPAGPFADPGFVDVPADHPFRTEIGWAAAEGLTEGFPDGGFHPSEPVSRQGAAALVHRLDGAPAGPFADPGFVDVPADHPFRTEIAWLAEQGLTTGYLDGTYRPGAPVSRQAAAALLYRRAQRAQVAPDTADRCEFLDPSHCLLPFPSDHLTVAEAAVDRPIGTSGTGLRLNLHPDSVPHNTSDIALDPTQLNMNDGFSPGSPVLVQVPGIDLAVTGAAPITDLARAMDADAPIVIIDADTGARVPLFAELDATPGIAPDEQVLFVRPTVNLAPGRRYVVALRRLRTAAGEPIAAPETFAVYRDWVHTGIATVEARRPEMAEVFDALADAGIARHDLYLAWDFTVASDQNLSERMLHLRDEAFGELGADVPTFTPTSVEHDVNASVATVIRGSLDVPQYLDDEGGPGTTMVYGPDGLPEQNGTMTIDVTCIVPYAATGMTPARISLFGHGLLGDGDQVLGFSTVAEAHDTVLCGTDWLGMSNADLATVGGLLGELSGFATLPDRAQQGFLGFLYLGRWMQHPDGLASLPELSDGDGSLLDRSELFYVGGSQGGIMGGALAAFAQDFTKAVLAVPGMNYSTMLQRSSNWPVFDLILGGGYPSPRDKAIALSLVQGLWDRGESNGYAHRIVHDPYPGTPAKQVLLFEAFGDHQVANVATETMARTMDIPVRRPALGPGRTPIVDPYWGLDPVPSSPYAGSALVVWDWGTPAPPTTNRWPTEGDDPHGNVGDPPEVAAQSMLLQFLLQGELVDVCAGAPCTTP